MTKAGQWSVVGAVLAFHFGGDLLWTALCSWMPTELPIFGGIGFSVSSCCSWGRLIVR